MLTILQFYKSIFKVIAERYAPIVKLPRGHARGITDAMASLCLLLRICKRRYPDHIITRSLSLL